MAKYFENFQQATLGNPRQLDVTSDSCKFCSDEFTLECRILIRLSCIVTDQFAI